MVRGAIVGACPIAVICEAAPWRNLHASLVHQRARRLRRFTRPRGAPCWPTYEGSLSAASRSSGEAARPVTFGQWRIGRLPDAARPHDISQKRILNGLFSVLRDPALCTPAASHSRRPKDQFPWLSVARLFLVKR